MNAFKVAAHIAGDLPKEVKPCKAATDSDKALARSKRHCQPKSPMPQR